MLQRRLGEVGRPLVEGERDAGRLNAEEQAPMAWRVRDDFWDGADLVVRAWCRRAHDGVHPSSGRPGGAPVEGPLEVCRAEGVPSTDVGPPAARPRAAAV